MKRVLGAALAAALLSACAGLSAPGATKTETPQQSLATTGKAMGQLKSAKFDVAGTVQVTLPQSLVDQLKAKGGAQAGALSSNMTATLKISGAAQKPDQLQANVSARLGGLTIETKVVAVGGAIYYTDPMTSKWEVLKRPEATAPKSSPGTLSYQAILDTATSITEVTEFNLPVGSIAHVTAHVVIDLHDFNTQLKIQAPTVAG